MNKVGEVMGMILIELEKGEATPEGAAEQADGGARPGCKALGVLRMAGSRRIEKGDLHVHRNE